MINVVAVSFTAALCAVLSVGPAAAGNNKSFVSATGSDSNNCTMANPCHSLQRAIDQTSSEGLVSCLDSDDYSSLVFISTSVTIDCGGTTAAAGPFVITASGITVAIKNIIIFKTTIAVPPLTINYPAIEADQAAAVIVDNVHMTGVANSAIAVYASSAIKIAVSNCIINNSNAGILVQPGSGGSVAATLDHVLIENNNGGGVKIDSTRTTGSVTVDVSNSTVSLNAGNGLNALSGAAGGANILSLRNTVVAANGTAGVQANGANAAALIATTLLDSNVGGALSGVAGGRLLSYGNNSIVGSSGTGFTGSAPLQ
jgi:hypothetical protein